MANNIKLTPLLNELDFRSQAAFDKYNSTHKVRNSTKVTIAGKTTTAGEAEKKTKKKKPNSMFGADYKKDRSDKKDKKKDSTRKTGWKREAGAPYAEDDKFWNDRFLPGDKVDGDITTEEDFHMYRTVKIGISLNDWFKAKDKKDFNYDFTPTGNGNIIISSEDGPVSFQMFSDDKNGIYNFGFVDNDGEFTFGRNEYFGGWDGYDDPQYVYQSMRYIMAQPETIQLLRGEITTREYKPMYEKFKKELQSSNTNEITKYSKVKKESTKLTSMLPETEDFQAKSKETGKLVHFKSKDAYRAALKAGTHEDPKAKKGGEPKAAAKPNSMFGGDYAKDRGAKAASKSNTNWMDDLDSIDVSDIKGKADPDADSFTSNDLYGATFKDPQTGKTITVGDAYEREDDSPAYQKAFAYVSKFDPDKEAVMGTQAYDDLNKKAAPKAEPTTSVDGQSDDELYDALYDMGYDFGELGSDDFDEEGFSDAAINLGYRWDDKNKVWNHRDAKNNSDAPKADTPKSNLPKKASQLKYKHAESLEKAINTETGLEGVADTDDNGAIVYNASNGSMPTYTLYMGSNIDYGNPDEFRVSLESTYANDPAELSGKVDKTFKSADDAMKFMVDVAKKYKKELQMDIDDDTNESTKLTSMIKK